MVVRSPVGCKPANEEPVALVREDLKKTDTNNSPGPDRIPYRLLKLIQDSNLGKAILNDIARVADGKVAIPTETQGPKKVMIPKPGKDITKVKGWSNNRLAFQPHMPRCSHQQGQRPNERQDKAREC